MLSKDVAPNCMDMVIKAKSSDQSFIKDFSFESFLCIDIDMTEQLLAFIKDYSFQSFVFSHVTL